MTLRGSRRRFRILAASLACLLGPLACGERHGASTPSAPAAAPPAVSAAAPTAPPRADFSGTYRVVGKTTEKESGTSRALQGTIVLSQQGTSYTSTFELETEIPTPEGQPAHAQVVGKGEGSLEDDALRGTAQTQIVWSQVPGVNSNFAFAPRRYGPRLASKSVARLDSAGGLVIEIDSTGQPGEAYRPTHTTLRGTRVSPMGK